jgi:lysophospholipase L1-like esterase
VTSPPETPGHPWFRRSLALCYGALWAGFLLHESRNGVGPLPWSVGYLAFLVVVALPLILPLLVRRLVARYGWKPVAVGAVTLVLTYGAVREHYYYTQQHRFDPFLQYPNPRFEGEFERQKPAGTLRVMCLGGSTTRNRVLRPADRWPEVLRAELQARYPDLVVEVLNAGQDSYTTRHSLSAYVGYGAEWEPDVVVVMHAINDLVRSFSPRAFALGEYDDLWTHYYQSAAKGADPPTFERSVLGRPFESWCSVLRVREVPVPLERFRSLARFRTNLAALLRYVQADGAEPLVVGMPTLLKADMSPAELDALRFARTFCIEERGWWRRELPDTPSMLRAMTAFRAATAEVAEAAGALYVDGQQHVPADQVHFDDDAHYWAPGSIALGKGLARDLAASGAIERALAR